MLSIKKKLTFFKFLTKKNIIDKMIFENSKCEKKISSISHVNKKSKTYCIFIFVTNEKKILKNQGEKLVTLCTCGKFLTKSYSCWSWEHFIIFFLTIHTQHSFILAVFFEQGSNLSYWRIIFLEFFPCKPTKKITENSIFGPTPRKQIILVYS